MTDDDAVPEPYLPLWQIAVLMVAVNALGALGVAALVRSPAYAATLLTNPLAYLVFGFFTTIALVGLFYQNRANLP